MSAIESAAADQFKRMKDEAYVASATSADDEMRRDDLVKGYVRKPINRGRTVKYTEDGKSFFLVNDGEAANFLHKGALGPAIHLIQGEIVAAAHSISSSRHDGLPYFTPGFHEMPLTHRELVKKSWKEAFPNQPIPPLDR